MENKVVYLIENIEEYGKLMAYCIENDISVWRCYWDERVKGDRCFEISSVSRCCLFSRLSYYQGFNVKIVKPKFIVDKYGCYQIEKE